MEQIIILLPLLFLIISFTKDAFKSCIKTNINRFKFKELNFLNVLTVLNHLENNFDIVFKLGYLNVVLDARHINKQCF